MRKISILISGLFGIKIAQKKQGACMDCLFDLVFPNIIFEYWKSCGDGSFEGTLVWQFKQTYLAGLLKLLFSLFKTNPRSDFGDEKF